MRAKELCNVMESIQGLLENTRINFCESVSCDEYYKGKCMLRWTSMDANGKCQGHRHKKR